MTDSVIIVRPNHPCRLQNIACIDLNFVGNTPVSTVVVGDKYVCANSDCSMKFQILYNIKLPVKTTNDSDPWSFAIPINVIRHMKLKNQGFKLVVAHMQQIKVNPAQFDINAYKKVVQK